MVSRFRKAALASALFATTLSAASPALADHGDYDGYRQRGRGDSTGAAIIGGIVGIAIGALIASSSNKNKHNRYRHNGEYRDGYYYDRDGRRYDRDGRYDRDSQDYYQRRGYSYGYGNGNGGYDDRYNSDRGDGYRGH